MSVVPRIMVTLHVHCESPEDADKITEKIAHMIVGYALEGYYTSMHVSQMEEDEDD